jgi:hypothetical protein
MRGAFMVAAAIAAVMSICTLFVPAVVRRQHALRGPVKPLRCRAIA